MPTLPPITGLTVLTALLVGVVFALLGHLKLALARRPEAPQAPAGRLLALLNFTLIPLALLSGVLVDLCGARPVLVAGSVLLALAFLALSAGATYGRTLLAVCAAAAGTSALWVCLLVLLPAGLFSPDERTASIELGLVLVALGAALTPPFFDLVEHLIGFRRTMAALALLLLLPALIAAVVRGRDFPGATPPARLAEALAEPNVWLAGAVFFAYAPLEAFAGVWVTAYLAGKGRPQSQSAWLAGFWCAVLASRTLLPVVQHAAGWGDEAGRWSVVFSALLAAVVLGNMAGSAQPRRAFWGLLLLGFALGPLFPTLVGLLFAGPRVQGAPGTAFGCVYAAGSLGCLVLAPMVNLSAGARSIQAALRVPLVIALGLTAVAILFALSGA